MWITTFVVENWCPLRHQQWDDNACWLLSEMSTSQAMHSWSFAICFLCAGLRSNFRDTAMLPNLYRAGKLNIVVLVPAFGCYSCFFLHSAEPSVKLVEIVFTHSTKCISTNLFKKITENTTCTGGKDPSETTRAFRQSGLIPQFTRFSVSVAWVESQRLGQTSFFCGQESRSVGASGCEESSGKRWKMPFVGTKYYELM